ncbi:MAG: hypothetical protein IJ911_02100 [Salinivirgaceae bacterium]|nr:hypothetical protein [Salinivirgaceae bacterium]
MKDRFEETHEIDCLVDTQPMADSIDTVSKKVGETTIAVGAFKSAVLKAEKEGAEHVCKNVNLGFFTLMHSQISQKIAAHQSRVDSLTMELVSQKKRLLAIKSAMERNYDMIVARYARVFAGINKALKQRVMELDRPTFNFATREIAGSFTRSQSLSAVVPICQIEGVTATQQIAMSNMKYDSTKVINATESFLRQMNEQKIITDKILLRSVTGDEGVEHFPVAIIETQIDANGNTAYDTVVPENIASPNAKEIVSQMYESAANFDWKEKEMNDFVRQEFAKLVYNSEMSDRVKSMVNVLYEESKPQTL